MRDHAPGPESTAQSRPGSSRHFPYGAGMILAVVAWGLLLVGIVAGVTLERWVL
ncbi:MAG: hypothetical protein GYB53_11475 [Rhodobacteraceae bacterium]|nr:hypothetical protein [Paracoccaceae bacterium]MBR9820748.1 hypothetical protein [Paracoccaceae bacterium]